MTETITINLGDKSKKEIKIRGAEIFKTKIFFKNTGSVGITLTTPKGMSPEGKTNIAVGETETHSGFKINNNKKAEYEYSWFWKDVDSPELATRSGTIRVT